MATATITPGVLAARADRLARAAATLETRHEDYLATRARELRDWRETQTAGRSPRYVGPLNLRGTLAGNEAYRHGVGDAQTAKARDGYAYNVRDEDRYRADGGRKSLADHRADYLEILERDRAAGADIGADEAAMLDDLALAAMLAVRADADRRLAEILAADPDDWRYDDTDRALAETEALETIPVGAGLLTDAKSRGVTDGDLDAKPGEAGALADVPANAPEAIGYVRTDPRETGAPDAEAQAAAITRAAAQKGWRVRVLADVAGGTASDTRPALAEAMRAMDAGGRPALIVSQLDRLARSAPVVGRVLERAQRKGWTLRALDIALDTGTSAGRRRAADIIEVGSWGRTSISEPTKAGMARAAAEGRLPGRRPLDAETVERLRTMRTVRDDGKRMSYRAIADQLNTDNVPTAQGGRWHERTVRRILAREAQEGAEQ